MTKAELIEKIQEQMNCNRRDAESALIGVFAAITDALAAGDKVTISGFGAFELRQRNAKQCKNPRTGEPVQVPASKAPVFKASKNLKETVNK